MSRATTQHLPCRDCGQVQAFLIERGAHLTGPHAVLLLCGSCLAKRTLAVRRGEKAPRLRKRKSPS